MMRLFLVAGLVVVASGQTAPPRQASLMLPAVALEAADDGALALAFVIAQFGLPGGVVTSADPSSPQFAELATRLTEPPTVSVADALERLVGAHPTHDVIWREDVLGIEERDLVCGAEARSRNVGPVSISGDMPRLIVILGWLAAGQEGPIPAGSMSPATRTTIEAAPLQAVDIASEEALSLADGLDEVVHQSQGGVWIIWQHERADDQIGCRVAAYFPNGYVGASAADFAVR